MAAIVVMQCSNPVFMLIGSSTQVEKIMVWISLSKNTQIMLRGIAENVTFKHIMDIFSPQYNLHGIVYGHNALLQQVYTYLWLSSEYIVVYLEYSMPQNFTIVKFGHPVSKSWLSLRLRFLDLLIDLWKMLYTYIYI